MSAVLEGAHAESGTVVVPTPNRSTSKVRRGRQEPTPPETPTNSGDVASSIFSPPRLLVGCERVGRPGRRSTAEVLAIKTPAPPLDGARVEDSNLGACEICTCPHRLVDALENYQAPPVGRTLVLVPLLQRADVMFLEHEQPPLSRRAPCPSATTRSRSLYAYAVALGRTVTRLAEQSIVERDAPRVELLAVGVTSPQKLAVLLVRQTVGLARELHALLRTPVLRTLRLWCRSLASVRCGLLSCSPVEG